MTPAIDVSRCSNNYYYKENVFCQLHGLMIWTQELMCLISSIGELLTILTISK